MQACKYFPAFIALAAILSMLGAATGRADDSALDRYVAAPDAHYRWALRSSIPGEGYTAYLLEMTSQQWRTQEEVDRPVWTHWLTIVTPRDVRTDIGLLVIGGGANDRPPPAQVSPVLVSLAVATQSVVSELRNVPNEPLVFAGETRKRSEDAITAYTWDRYLRTGDETWPLRLPMTKAAIRAMDTVTAFCGSAAGGGVVVGRFVVGGASKRGWTSWTTAAVDKRVVAVVPVVIDLLNVEPSFEHHYRVYGFWAPALREYEALGIMRRAGTPALAALLGIEDPYAYRDRLTMPKFVINATGDQFFVPDSSQFYIDGLPGETYLRYVPNTDHSLKGGDFDAALSALAFYESIINGTARPRFTWRFEPDGAIRVATETTPSEVRLWRATNPRARDFRLETIGPAFASTVLEPQPGGLYVGSVPAPPQGWTAYFVELTFPNGDREPFKFTTGVRVTPDVLPFPPPSRAGGDEPPSPGIGR